MTKYELVEHPNSFHKEHHSIKILDGPLEGVVYQYDTISFAEEEHEDGSMTLSFNTLELENPLNYDLSSEENGSIIGDILVEIIEQSIKDYDELGTADLNEPSE